MKWTERDTGASSSERGLLVRIILCIICAGAVLACAQRREGIGPGEAAPAFTLPSLNGDSVSLEDFKGKVVLLNFWAAWCAPCIAEMPALNKLPELLGSDKFAVVTIAEDEGKQELEEFRQKYKLRLPILLDEKGEMRRKYKVNGFPESFLLDPKGKILLMKDPDGGMPRSKLIGPRDWLSETSLGLFKEILSTELTSRSDGP